MTDFFADLESELRTAHRKDAKRSRLARLRRQVPARRIVFAVTAAVVAAVAVTSLARIGARDEVPADGGNNPTQSIYTITNCLPADGREVPSELRDYFALLRESGEQPLPPDERVTEPLDVARVFTADSRLVESRDEQLTVVPVLLRNQGCESGMLVAGVCLGVYDREERSALACGPVSKIQAFGLEFRAPSGDGETLHVLVPDRVEEIRVGTTGVSYRAPVIDNIATMKLDADQRGDDVLPLVTEAITPVDKTYEPPPDTDCRTIGKLDGPIPAEITRDFALFAEPDMSDYAQGGADLGELLAAVYFRGGTTFTAGGDEFALVAGRLAGSNRPCDDLPLGICAGRLGGDEVECAAVAEIRRLGLTVRVDEGDSERLVVVVPDGVTQVRFRGGPTQTVQDNVASVRLRPGATVSTLERR